MATPAQTLRGGPWTGVRATTDPWDDRPNELTGAVNGYVPDPASGSAFYARPGFSHPTTIPQQGPAGEVFGFIATDGMAYNFIIAGGKVFRITTSLSTAPTDVTPLNVSIHDGKDSGGNPTAQRAIYCNQLNGQLIVSDGVNKPWLGSNLSSTPITATPIEWNTAATILSRGTTDTKVAYAAFTAAFYQNHAVTVAPVAANPVGATLAAGTIPINQWGVYRVECDNSATVTVTAGAANFTTGYATEAAAIAAVPIVTSGTPLHWDMGYFTVQTHAATTFIGGTDALAGGVSGNVAAATNYYPGQGMPWSAYGNVEIYGGDVVFILNTLGSTTYRTTIGWSEPNQPSVGYQQTTYDNAWTLTQTGATPLYALKSTNAALFYARAGAWGRLTGQPSLNFKNDANHDSVSMNIGCVNGKTVRTFGEYVYFCDQVGRPYRFAIGGTPEPLWLQLRQSFDAQSVAGNAVTATVNSFAWGIVEPNLNLYLVGCWPLTATSPYSPVTLYAFDALTGTYMGTWTMGGDRFMDIGGLLTDTNGQQTLLIMGRVAAQTYGGGCWKLAKVSDNVWQDNGTTLTVSAQTQRFGYSMGGIVNPSVVRAVANVATPMTLSTVSTNGTQTTLTATPPSSSDGTYRAVWTPDAAEGRGIQCTVSPTTTTSQWQLFGIEVDVTTARAPLDER